MDRPAVVTMKDVARAAGVSTYVVSTVLSDRWREKHLSAACASRVREVAARIGYVPNLAARALRSGRSGCVGLVLPSDKTLDHPGMAYALVSAVERALAAHSHDLILIGATERLDEFAHGLEHLHHRRVDALIVPGTLGALVGSQALSQASGAIVVAFRGRPSPHPTVDIDEDPGLRAAVEHLAGLGHRAIAWIGMGAAALDTRWQALRALCPPGIALSRLALEQAIPTARSVMARARFAEAWRAGERPAAAMCFNDDIAIGVCQAAHDLGVRVPDALSVIGFDDVGACESCVPPLTTISHAIAEIGRRAAERALALARGGAPPGEALELVPAHLVVRESTALPKHA